MYHLRGTGGAAPVCCCQATARGRKCRWLALGRLIAKLGAAAHCLSDQLWPRGIRPTVGKSAAHAPGAITGKFIIILNSVNGALALLYP